MSGLSSRHVGVIFVQNEFFQPQKEHIPHPNYINHVKANMNSGVMNIHLLQCAEIFIHHTIRGIQNKMDNTQKEITSELPVICYTAIPNFFLDEIAFQLSPSELRVMLYIYRRTLGFQKMADTISYQQFLQGIVTRDGRRLDSGAGVSRGALSVALANLERHKLIERFYNKNDITYRLVLEEADKVDVQFQQQEQVVKEVQNLNFNDLKSGSKLEHTKQSRSKTQNKDNRAAEGLCSQPQSQKGGVLLSKSQVDITQKACQIITDWVGDITNQQAKTLVNIAFANDRDENYIAQLVEYVTTSASIRVPAATLTTLVQQNAVRSAGKQPIPSKPSSKRSTAQTTLSRSGLAGLFGEERAAYFRSLALKKGIGSSRIDSMLCQAKQAPSGSQRALFERLFNAAISASPYNLS
jgi:DNA-binding MarR family transcriptional regulator